MPDAPDTFSTNFGFSLPFLPHMQEIAGRQLVQVASLEDDLRRNTDLITLAGGDLRYACRVRRQHYANRYGDEFTIRSSVGGRPTELQKIRAGWGDYLIYGFGAAGERRMRRWFLGDLHVFRGWIACNHLPTDTSNGDGTSFKAFQLAAMPPRFIVSASWVDEPRQMELTA